MIIEITESEYKSLRDKELRLSALIAAGVEDWLGYEQAKKIYIESQIQEGEGEEFIYG